jgi:glycerol-3-phosphate dehydrogenase
MSAAPPPRRGVASYAPVVRCFRSGQATGVVVATASPAQGPPRVHAEVIVNAAALGRRPPPQEERRRRTPLQLTKGVHLVVPHAAADRAHGDHPAADRRSVFAVPAATWSTSAPPTPSITRRLPGPTIEAADVDYCWPPPPALQRTPP